MKVILIAVFSVDGKITKGEDPNIYTWTSKEDTIFFSSMIQKHNLIVMGRNTYEAAKNVISLQNDKRRIVLTRNPEKFATSVVPKMLEFSNESALKLVTRLEKQGYQELLLVGGSIINTLFLKAGLVDEVHLTIEPSIFGTGNMLVSNENMNVSLRLISVKKLNEKGTLHLRYKVEKK